MDYKQIFTFRRLWLIFGISLALMFSILLLMGGRIYQQAPPLPQQVQADGHTLFTAAQINGGRDVWRQLGGMQLGSIWGHGGYLAPDWTADFLHREAMAMLQGRAGGAYESLDEGERAALRARLATEMRRNTFDEATGILHLSAERAAAIERTMEHYQGLFAGDEARYEKLREQYAIPNSPAGGLDEGQIRSLSAFFWWTSWAAVTHRPDDSVSYTNNWPHEPLVGNRPTAHTFIWSFISVVLLIAGIGLLCWFFNRERESWSLDQAPHDGYSRVNPLDDVKPTKSMLAVRKYIWLVAVLIGVQILLGAVTAHYAVEGHDFYGLPAVRLAAVRADAHLAHPDRGYLDSRRLAGRRALRRAADGRGRAAPPALGGQLSVRGFAGGGGGGHGRAICGGARRLQGQPGAELLVWPPGI